MIPDTYFLVKVWIDKDEYTYGPYFELDYAMLILVDHVPDIVTAKVEKKHFNYKAEIHECILGRNPTWIIVSIPITENECRKTRH